MNATAAKDAIELGRDWAEADRWNGIDRHYAPEDVLRLRGSLRIEHTLARHGAEKLWRLLAEEDYVAALGALTGGQAVQMAKQSPVPLAFADVADNPGGGGRGNTMHILAAFHAAGARGARFHMLGGAPQGWEALAPVAAKVAPLGWHVQLQFDGNALPVRETMLRALPCPVVGHIHGGALILDLRCLDRDEDLLGALSA